MKKKVQATWEPDDEMQERFQNLNPEWGPDEQMYLFFFSLSTSIINLEMWDTIIIQGDTAVY